MLPISTIYPKRLVIKRLIVKVQVLQWMNCNGSDRRILRGQNPRDATETRPGPTRPATQLSDVSSSRGQVGP